MKKISPLNPEKIRLLTIICSSNYVKPFAKERANIYLRSDKGHTAQDIAEALGCDRKKVSKAIDDWNDHGYLALGIDKRGQSENASIPPRKLKDLSLMQLDFCIEIEPEEALKEKLQNCRIAKLKSVAFLCYRTALDARSFMNFERSFNKDFDFQNPCFRKDFRSLKVSFLKSLMRKKESSGFIENRLKQLILTIEYLNTSAEKYRKPLVKSFLKKLPDDINDLVTWKSDVLDAHLLDQIAYVLEPELRGCLRKNFGGRKEPVMNEDLMDFGHWAITKIWRQSEMDADRRWRIQSTDIYSHFFQGIKLWWD